MTATQGGQDAQWWASELTRSYMKYASKLGLDIEILEETATGSGTRRTVLQIDNANFRTWRLEHGIHRISHISQYGNGSKRQTSFARVSVIPLVAEKEVKLADADIQIEYFKGSGPGGQHKNKVMTGVKLKHVPTGIQVSISRGRQQHQNMQLARQILFSRLQEYELEKQEADKYKIAEAGQGSFGGWHRSYTLQGATQQLKDWQTGRTYKNVKDVLRKGDFGPWHKLLLS